MAALTVVASARFANAITWANAAGGGDEFANTGKELLLVSHTNGGGSTVTLTITTEATSDGLAVADRTVSIAAGSFHVLGPFPKGIYNDADGNVNLAWSSATDIDIAVIRPATS